MATKPPTSVVINSAEVLFIYYWRRLIDPEHADHILKIWYAELSKNNFEIANEEQDVNRIYRGNTWKHNMIQMGVSAYRVHCMQQISWRIEECSIELAMLWASPFSGTPTCVTSHCLRRSVSVGSMAVAQRGLEQVCVTWIFTPLERYQRLHLLV